MSSHFICGKCAANGQRLVDAICAEADDSGCGDEVRRRFKAARTEIYWLLDHPNPGLLTEPIPQCVLKDTLLNAMNCLRMIYRLSQARVLLASDLNELECWTDAFYRLWLQLQSLDAARYPVRPKCICLLHTSSRLHDRFYSVLDQSAVTLILATRRKLLRS
uniref:Uncharacterized protein n=1 Tax=Globodera rostochiensis TaxID=31243 RepID=A0A914H3J7_GLORO